MVDTPNDLPEEFAETREHEYQDPHYHDEEPEIVDDEGTPLGNPTPVAKKKTNRRPPPLRRYYED